MRIIYDNNQITVRTVFIEEKYIKFLINKTNKREINIQSLVNSINWVYNEKNALTKHLKEGKLPIITKNEENSFNKLVSLLNLAKFNLKFGSYKTVDEIFENIKTYFTKQSNVDLSCKLIGILLKDLHVFWLFPELLKNSSLMNNCYLGLTNLIANSINKDNIQKNVSETTFMKKILLPIKCQHNTKECFLKDNISQEMIINVFEKLLEKYISLYPTLNHLCNITDLESLKINITALKTFPLQLEFGFVDSDRQICFDIITLRNRIIKYSDNILNENFPFDKSSFIIAGGFPTNVICGLRSKYTDLDFYIFKNFNETCKKIIDHLTKNYEIELTYNSCIINVILIGKHMNIQLINTKEIGQEIIDNFDLTYSQAMISSWDCIEITLGAYKSYLTGKFEINSNVRINPSRILKAYIKGFQLDNHSIRKAIGTKIDDDAKTILKELKDNDDITKVLKKHLSKGSVNYQILTKAVYLDSDIYQKLAKSKIYMKEYLEKVTKFKYLKFTDLLKKTFKPLEIYGSKYNGYGSYDGYDEDLHTLDKVTKFVKGNTETNPRRIIKTYLLQAMYPNETVESVYTFSTIIDQTSIKNYGRSYLTVSGNHPLVKHILKIEDKIKKDFANLGLKFKSRIITNKTNKFLVNIPLKTPDTYSVNKQEFCNRDKCKKENESCHLKPSNEPYFTDYIKANPTPNKLFKVIFSLRNLWIVNNEYSYTIRLSSKVYLIDKKNNIESPLPDDILNLNS